MSEPRSFSDLRFHRGVLSTPDGPIPMVRIGKGMFSVIYRETGGEGRVFAFTKDSTWDKEIAASAYDDTHNPHLPAVLQYGSTAQEHVYVMPFYKTPFRKGDSLQGWKDYTQILQCLEAVRPSFPYRGASESVHEGYQFSSAVVDCANSKGVRPSVVEALDALVQTSANYGDTYRFEFSPRNLATDSKGNLILLDVLFDQEALIRARKAVRRDAGARG